jgi:streptogramin lyase
MLNNGPARASGAAGSGSGSMVEFTLPHGSGPWGIAAGPDGNLWYTDDGSGKIGRITLSGAVTQFSLPIATSEPGGVVTGPDGNIWFVEQAGNKIGRIATTPPYAISEFPLPGVNSWPTDIAVGADGNLWFTEYNGNKIGSISTIGAINEYALPTSDAGLSGIQGGPDGNLWFIEANGNRVGRILSGGSHTITEFPVLPNNFSYPQDIVPGADGNMWFTEEGLPGRIGRILTASPNTITEFPTPTANTGPFGIASGADGTLWFAEAYTDAVGQIDVSGQFVGEYSTPTTQSSPYGIAEGPDAQLWVAEFGGDRIAKVTEVPTPAMTLVPNSGPPGTSVLVTGSGFGAMEKVQLAFFDSVHGRISLGSTRSDPSGHISKTVRVPSSATQGHQSMGARGSISMVTVKSPFEVT